MTATTTRTRRTRKPAEPKPEPQKPAQPETPVAEFSADAKPVTYYWGVAKLGDKVVRCECKYGHESEAAAIRHARSLLAKS
jgi:hypothetical protein